MAANTDLMMALGLWPPRPANLVTVNQEGWICPQCKRTNGPLALQCLCSGIYSIRMETAQDAPPPAFPVVNEEWYL